MITDRQVALTLEQYSKRGVLKQEIRSYEVSLWTLQDSFITVLKWSDVEQKGRIEEPKMTLNIDGTQKFTFNVPMYFYQNGKLVANPNWENIRSGNTLTSTRKVKVIFNKRTADEAVFEFLILDVKETHENDILTCEVSSEGLAFHELGKIGYRYTLSHEDFLNDNNAWLDAGHKTALLNTIDYWCSKINLLPYPTNEPVNSRTWYYKVEMSWKSFRGTRQRTSNKIYEEGYTTSWTEDLRPKTTQSFKEKCRSIDVENSNIYNITQELAETFGVFCRYDYGYDENYHIISRTVVFYNNFLKEDEDVITLAYPHSSQSIRREMDCTNLTTKLYVLDVDDDEAFDGYHSIMNAEPNPTRENYILNFEYMHDIGNINDEQYAAIKEYEIQMKKLNDKLIRLQTNLIAYEEIKTDLKAKIKVHSTSKETAIEQLEQCSDLRNALDLSDGDADGYITVDNTNPDQKFILPDTTGGNYIKLDNANKGIISGTLKIYKNYNSTTQELSTELLNFTPIVDEYNNITMIKGLPAVTSGSAKVYLTYKYNPKLYYDAIMKTWEERIGKDTSELLALKSTLGNEDYNPNVDDVTIRAAYEDLLQIINNATIPGTVEIDYYKRPHLLDADNNIMTYYSSSYSNASGSRVVLVTPILPNGVMLSKDRIAELGNGYVNDEIGINSVIYSSGTSSYKFSDIFMGLYGSLWAADNAALAYHAYHEAVMMSNSGGLYRIIKDTKAEIEAITNKKNDLILAFEHMMGPALREGYWQPEDYNDYGENKSISLEMTTTADGSTITEDTLNDMVFGWESDPSLFDGELDIHYKMGAEENVYTYPCINLSSLLATIGPNIENYTFIYNNNYLDEVVEINSIKNMAMYSVGSKAMLRFVRANGQIYPALVLIGAKTLYGSKEDDTTALGWFYNRAKSHPRLAIVNSSVNQDTGMLTTTLTGEISLEDSSYWTFGGYQPEACEVVYPRIKCSSLSLKTNSSELIIKYDEYGLKEFEDYYINTRNTERNGNYYAEYYITIDPTIIYKRGVGGTFDVNYVLSNANTAIYLDAKEVSNENAYPKVSYEITPNILNPDFSRILYKKMAQLVKINDVDLKLQNTFGYISELNLDLDNVNNDSITIKNYKTKFEDLFSSIVAQTEEMKRISGNLTSAASGGVPLNEDAFGLSLRQHKSVFEAYLDSYFDSSQVVKNRLAEIFNEAGEILGSANKSLNRMQTVTTGNAAILSGFAENVADALTTKVYRQQERPTEFSFGDVWIQTDSNGNELGRYMATSNGQSLDDDSTAGFVRTWDGTLAQIMGANLNIDADQGIIDVEARNQINIKSGNNIYIAANERVDIVGNSSVNIGGSEINFCSLHLQDAEGNQLQEVVPVKGINLIAGEYSLKGTGQVSEIIIQPTKIEFQSSDILMKAASSIEMLASTGTAAGTSAISLSAENGVWIGAGAGLRLYSGTASDHIWVGPKHKPTFKKGDIWVRVEQVGENGHASYDGDPALSQGLSGYYTDFLENGNGEGQYVATYIATSNWEDVYTTEAAANTGANTTAGWVQREGVIDIHDVSRAKGASVELNQEHLLLGFANLSNNSGSTAIEMTDEYIVLAAGQGFNVSAARTVTGSADTGLIGAKFTKNDIGLAVQTQEGNTTIVTAMIMNGNGFTVGSGFTNVNLATASDDSLRNVEDGSYVRISPRGIEVGSMSDLYINTDNFKLQTHSRDIGNNLFGEGNTLLAVGSGLQDVSYDTTLEELEDMVEAEEADIKLVLNNEGLFLRGDVYAENGEFNGVVYARDGQFTGDIVARSLTLIDTSGNNQDVIDFYDYLTKLQAQVDGEIDTWFGQVDPTPNNKAGSALTYNTPANDWNTTALKDRHLGDIYYNNVTGEGFRWVKNTNNSYIWNSIGDTEITNLQTNVREIHDGTTGLAFTNTGANTFVNLTNALGLVIMGQRQTTGPYTGYYPYLRASNNAMGFFYSTSVASAAAPSNADKAMMYFEDGDMFLAGTLWVDDVRIRNHRTDTTSVSWDTYWTNYHDSIRTEVTSQITDLFTEAGNILNLSASTLTDVSNLTTTNQAILQGYINKVIDLQPDIYTGATPPLTFKPGDMWNPSSGTYSGQKYIATSYSSKSNVDQSVNVLRGWNRVSNGSLASITGAGITIDSEAGTIDLYAGSTMTLRAKTVLDLSSGDIQITGNNSINIGSKWINIGAANGGINITATNIGSNSTTSGAKSAGISYVTIDRSGIKVASSNIEVESTGKIEAYYADGNTEASAVKIDSDGVTIAATRGIHLSSNQGSTSGKVYGTNFDLTPERMLFGASNSNSNSAISLDANQILLAVGTVANANSNTLITQTASNASVSGIQIRRDYIGVATGTGVNRTLVSIRPDKVLIGAGKQTEDEYGEDADGSYILMNYVVANSGTAQQRRVAQFSIGSSGIFKVLTPNLHINTSATESVDMFYLADASAWENANYGLHFNQRNGLFIKAAEFHVDANKIYIGPNTAESQFNATTKSTTKLYVTTASNDNQPDTPTNAGVNPNNINWTTQLQAATKHGNNNGHKYVWSTIETRTLNNVYSYTDPVQEGALETLAAVSYKVYKRTATNSAPTLNGNTISTWSLDIPAIEYENDSAVAANANIGQAAHTPKKVKTSYLWCADVTVALDDTETYGTPYLESGGFLDGLSAKSVEVLNLMDGTKPVPYVKSSGLTIDGDYVSLHSSGALRILGQSAIYIGSNSSNSKFYMDSNGIVIGTEGKITIYNSFTNSNTKTNAVILDKNGIEITSAGKLVVSAANIQFSTTNTDTLSKKLADDLQTAKDWTNDYMNGTKSFTKIQNTGFEMTNTDFTIQATGKLTMMADTTNNAVIIDKDGIELKTGARILMSASQIQLSTTAGDTLSAAMTTADTNAQGYASNAYTNANAETAKYMNGTYDFSKIKTTGITIEPNSLEIASTGSLTLATSVNGQTGNAIVMNGNGITIQSGGWVSIWSGGNLYINSTNMILNSGTDASYPTIFEVKDSLSNSLIKFHKDYGGYIGGWFVNKAWFWSGSGTSLVAMIGGDTTTGSLDQRNAYSASEFNSVRNWAFYAGSSWPEDRPYDDNSSTLGGCTYDSSGNIVAGTQYSTGFGAGWAPFRVTRDGYAYVKALCLGIGPSSLAGGEILTQSMAGDWGDISKNGIWVWLIGDTDETPSQKAWRWEFINNNELYNCIKDYQNIKDDIQTLNSRLNTVQSSSNTVSSGSRKTGSGNVASTTSGGSGGHPSYSSGGCFVRGTLIQLPNNKFIPIEEIQLGMEVIGYDLDTKNTTIDKVISMSIYEHKDQIFDIVLSNGKVITLTDSHPLLSSKGWVAMNPELSKTEHGLEVNKLKVGQELVSIGKEKIYISNIVYRTDLQDETVYICRTSPHRTFIVENIVTHNAKVNVLYVM